MFNWLKNKNIVFLFLNKCFFLVLSYIYVFLFIIVAFFYIIYIKLFYLIGQEHNFYILKKKNYASNT